MLDEYTRGFLIREIDRAQRPSGMSVHDGRVCIDASVIQRLLAVIDAQQAERDRLRVALAAAREWIAAERQSQAECVTLPDGSIDACERAALADIDAVLSEIDAAMAKEASDA